MTELLRDLVVSLSLDANNFTSNLKSIGVLLKQAQSEFNLAGAGIRNFEGTLTGMQASLNLLKNRLDLQKEAVAQYANKLNAAQTRLNQASETQAKYADKLASAKESLAMWQAEQQKLNAQLSVAKSRFGEDSAAVRVLQNAYDLSKAKVAEYEQSIAKLNEQYAKCQATTQRYADAVNRAQTDLNNAQAQAAALEGEVARLASTVENASKRFNIIGDSLRETGSAIQAFGEECLNAGRNLTNLVSKPIEEAARSALDASMQFESAFTTVRQVTSASDETYSEWTDAVKAMAEETGIASASIANTMAEAGRLGVQNENLVTFTRSALDLGQAFNMSATDAATSMARFFNIMGTTQDQVTQFGSATTYLANNYATTASEIMDMAKGLAGAGHTVGMTEQDILGVSTALTALGVTSGRGATTFSNALLKMETSAATGDKYLDDFAKVCGMTSEQFVEAWNFNPTSVFERFLLGLSNMTDEGESAIAALQDCGIKSVRLTDTLLRAAGAEEVIVNAISDANTAWDQGSELTDVANKRYQTTAIKLANLKNNFQNLMITVGDDIKPVAEVLINLGNSIVNWMDSLSQPFRQVIEVLAAVVAAVGPVIAVFGLLTKGVGMGVTAIGTLVKGVGTAWTAIGELLTGVNLLPVALVAAGVIAVATFADWVSGAHDARKAMEELNETVETWKENVQTSFEKSSGMSAFGLTKDDFAFSDVDTGAGWLDSTIETWTDGKKETDEIVSDTVKGFTDGTDQIRNALKSMNESGEGGTPMSGLDSDLQTLSDIDKEVEQILQNKQNGFLSEDEIGRLQELIDQREAIKIKYSLVSDIDSSFDKISMGVQAALSRGDDGENVFANAFSAATEGLGAFTDSLNAEYDAQYALISAMEASTDEEIQNKQQKFEELKEWYNTQAAAAQKEYYQTVVDAGEQSGVFGSDGVYGQAAEKLEHIRELMSDAAGKDENSEEVRALNQALAELDESTIVEMDSSLLAMQSAAEKAGTTVPDDVQKCADALDAVKKAAEGIDGVFTEGTAEALQSMFGGLSQETYEVYASLNCDNLSTAYDAWAAGEHAPIIPEIDTSSVTYDGTVEVEGTLLKVATPNGTFHVTNFTVDVDGTIQHINEDGSVTTVTDWKVGVDGELVHVDSNGTEYKVTGAKVTADGKLGEVTAEDGTYTVSPITVNGILGTITVDETAEVPEVEVKAKVVFENGGYTDNSLPDLGFKGAEQTSRENAFGLTYYSMDKTAADLSTLATAITQYNAAVEQYGKDSAEAQAFAESVEHVTGTVSEDAGTDAGLGFQNLANYIQNGLQLISNGEMDPAKLQEFMQVYSDLMTVLGGGDFSVEGTGTTFMDGLASALGSDSNWSGIDGLNIVESMQSAIEGVQPQLNALGVDTAAGIGEGAASYMFPESATVATTAASQLGSAFGQGSPCEITKPLGNDTAAGIGEGMKMYDFSADAAVTATNLMAAIGVAMSGGSGFDGSGIMSDIVNSLSGSDSDTSSIGKNLMEGIKSGIQAGRSGVIEAAKKAVADAIAAAKAQADIHSPSRVMRDEVGVMLMRGMGIGIDKEAKAASKTMSNAMNYTLGAATGYANGATTNDNRRTYNNQSTINLNIDGMSVRDDSDVRSLAIEIASLTRRNNQLKGVR